MKALALRCNLFMFYAAMAWLSLLRPRDGVEMINDANQGARHKAQLGVR